MYEKLLEGGYDLHVHTGPDVSERKLDDIDYGKRLINLGMKGFGIKSHYFSSASRARVVNKVVPGLNAIGTLVLNNTVGGLNPLAVEMAAKEGAKIVWMPTFDSENEIEYMNNQMGYEELPPWAKVQVDRKKEGKEQSSISILEDGKIKSSVYEILELVAQHNLVLASGHLGKKEIFTLARATKEQGIKKFVVTHPTFSSIALSKEEQKELTEMGAYLEICCGTITPKYGATWDEIYDQVKYIGPKNFIVSSDMGQVTNPFPDEGLLEAVKRFSNNGFSEDEIKTMTTENTTFLVES
ncbi:DUF6282 family protein [Oceanobacillus salinisoli]|uniref:DUF6282 family protein n=1 Tax=Oceanobacillus salinisoli TaxID=2678611 RepID=UPI0012E10522|nr:DUF6282 family protein [Oceanobacillus salinisoli]